MSRTELRPFTAADLAACGTLLADRHRRHRVAQPLLSARFEDAAVALAELTAAYETPDASGVVAYRAGVPVGFVLGAPKPSPLWGPNIWVEAAGLAVTDPEVMRDLYAVAAARWVDEGRTAHYVVVPAHDAELVRAWFRLGFGQQHAHAIRPAARPGTGTPVGLSVRRATRADIPALAQLELELPLHHGRSPTFPPAGWARWRRPSPSGRSTSTTPRTPPSWPSRTAGSSARPSAARWRSRAGT